MASIITVFFMIMSQSLIMSFIKMASIFFMIMSQKMTTLSIITSSLQTERSQSLEGNPRTWKVNYNHLKKNKYVKQSFSPLTPSLLSSLTPWQVDQRKIPRQRLQRTLQILKRRRSKGRCRSQDSSAGIVNNISFFRSDFYVPSKNLQITIHNLVLRNWK